MTTIENISSVEFNNKFGRDLASRMKKFHEEVKEFDEAMEEFLSATDPADRIKKREHLLDEIGDVQAVLSHITHILASDFQTVLTNAYIKVKVREHDNNYLK